MSVFTHKQVLVVGEDNSRLTSLAETLESHGVTIHKLPCDAFKIDHIKDNEIDLILLNHLGKEGSCINVLNTIRDNIESDATPVFALIQDSSEDIQEILRHGVADYITPNEEVSSVMSKIKAIFGQGEIFSEDIAIDITPPEATVTSTGIRVYIIEDDPLLRNLLSIRLDKSRFPYEFSADGADVVSAMKQFEPDVVILDLMLPGKSGFEVLSDIQSEASLKSIPVIVFSNRDGQEDRKKAQEMGVKGFYVKATTDLSELIETIESLVT